MPQGALWLSGRDVDHLVDIHDAVAQVQEAFQAEFDGRACNHPRVRLRIPETAQAREATDLRAMLHVLPATLSARELLGVKTYVSSARGATFVVVLFHARQGLLAVIEADRLGQMRTGAASGVATRFMAREDASVAAVIGTGWQARTQVEAVCSVRSIREVRAYGRNEEKRAGFCRELSDRLGIPVLPAADPREAVRGAHVVITATTSARPVLLGEWLEPGMHVNAAGSNAANRQELDSGAVMRAHAIVVDDRAQARVECGDLVALVQEGRLSWEAMATLAEVVGGGIRPRQLPGDITLFESQGLATEDLALATLCYERALERGEGTPLPRTEK